MANDLKNNVLNGLKKVLGVMLIIGGILGLFLPFLQGVAMILVGVALISDRASQRIQRWFVKIKSYFKKR